jgi:tetratricopeptide (TPR) repeat protein
LQQGDPDQALPELESTVALSPRFAVAHEALANAYHAVGKDSKALEQWHQALMLMPQDVTARISASRILSSSFDSTLRNGDQAVILAEQANELTKGADPAVLDTLAAAYAEAGNFQQALVSANRALDLAVDKGRSDMADAIRDRIQLYRTNTPYRR